VPTADELINPETVRALAAILEETSPTAAWSSVHAAADELGQLTLSQRARSVAAAIVDDGRSYSRLATATHAALANPELTGWMIWPLTEAVAAMATARGETGEFDDGLHLLAALTPRLTGEFAIRTFLNADLDRAMAAITGWTTHDDEAVRRLASEGTRPKLPWAKQVPRLTRDPGRTRPILDALYRDESDFVRRSVGNHLNDVSRLSAETARATATAWAAAPDVHTAALIRRGMRTLVKAGDGAALHLLGFTADPTQLQVHGPHLAETSVSLGGDIVFTADITNVGDVPAVLAIDYLIHHRKANGTTTAKTFKLATKNLAPRERTTIARSHSFKPITTRRYYPGTHAVELQVNGRRLGYTEFQLVAPVESA
jgi:3-methyladenine DNA glycosylase AlkC